MSVLGRAAARGAAVTFSAQGLRLLVQVAGIAVLGRLLSPTDYGLVAIVIVIVGYGELFRDFGLSSAAIAAPTLSDGQRDNLFWINTGIGVALAALLCAAAPLLGLVFGDDRLVLLSVVLSATFVLNGVSTQYRAVHARHLRFVALSTAEVAGQAAGVVVGISMALAGAGYWSLAGQQLSAQALTLVLLVRPHRWVPGWVDRTASVRSFIGYGSALLGSQLLTQVATSAAPLALGVRLGPASVGVFTRASQLVTMPLLQVQAPSTRVALPVLSRLTHERERFASFLLAGQLALLMVVGLAFAVLLAQAPSAVRVIIGPQWSAAVPVFQVLLVAGWFQAASYAGYWVYLAKGLTRRHLQLGLMTRPLMAAATVVAAQWGLQGAALAYAAGMALAWPVSLLWLRRVSDAPVGAMLRNGLRTGLVAVLAAAASWGSTAALPGGADLLRLVVGAGAALAVAAVAVLAWPSLRADVRKVTSMRHHLARRGPAGAPVAEPTTPARSTRAGRVAERTWVTAGLPAAVDRAVVAGALRRARRAADRGAGAQAPGQAPHVVIAAPGGGNIGDQALLEAFLENTTGPVLIPGGPLDGGPVLPPGLRSRVEVLEAPALVYGSGRAHRASLRAYGRALAGAGHVSVVGADVMDGTYSLRASVRRSTLAASAAGAGVDTRVVGFSWGASPRRAARRALARAARCGVRLMAREEVSARRLAADGIPGVESAADVVFAAATTDRSAADAILARTGPRPVALVNVSGLLAERVDLVEDHVRLVGALRRRGLAVVLLPHVWRGRAGDAAACAAVMERLDQDASADEVLLVQDVLSPAQVRGLAARAAVTVTGRMHLAVMSLMGGVPAITLATQGKVEGLMDLVGTPELCLEAAPGFAVRAVELVDEVLPAGSPARVAIAGSRERVTGLARRNLDGLPGAPSPAAPAVPAR